MHGLKRRIEPGSIWICRSGTVWLERRGLSSGRGEGFVIFFFSLVGGEIRESLVVSEREKQIKGTKKSFQRQTQLKCRHSIPAGQKARAGKTDKAIERAVGREKKQLKSALKPKKKNSSLDPGPR